MQLLVDVDSTIPNLALMKISRYLKNQGQNVDFIQMKGKDVLPLEEGMKLALKVYSGVWISSVFTWNRTLGERITAYCGCNMIEKRYHAWPVFVLLYATATLWGLQIVQWAFK